MSSHGDVKENVSGCFFSEHSVYIVVNDNWQRKMLNSVHTQKEDNYHKISHTMHNDHYNACSQQSAEDRTLGKHQWLKQLVLTFLHDVGGRSAHC